MAGPMKDPAPRDRGSDGVAEAVAELADEPGSVVWFRSSNSAEWEVAVGSPAWERLAGDGSERIDGPTKPKG